VGKVQSISNPSVDQLIIIEEVDNIIQRKQKSSGGMWWWILGAFVVGLLFWVRMR